MRQTERRRRTNDRFSANRFVAMLYLIVAFIYNILYGYVQYNDIRLCCDIFAGIYRRVNSSLRTSRGYLLTA